jgi:hypothetical protein
MGWGRPHACHVNTFAILRCHSLGMKKCQLPIPSAYPLFDGGAGRNFILNTAFQGKVWGDSKGGDGTEGKDIFWYFPGVFIMDASSEDRLQMFGIPLTGGTNTFDGLFSADSTGTLAKDWLLPFVYYGYTSSGQLIVHNTLYSVMAGETVGRGQAPLKSAMIIENFTFGDGFKPGAGRLQVPEKGDLGMTFRLLVASDVKEEFFILNRIFGQLVSWLNAVLETAKSLRWEVKNDPLIIDLDGDGVETVDVSQSRAFFDMDGDGFAERTSWVEADDGLLVLDRDGNGKIDDVTELFGGPGQAANDNATLQKWHAA